jgi:Holliday junction resolvasome RuvABC endonuclease subunit
MVTMVVAGLDCSTKKSGVSIMEDGELQFYTLVDLHKEKDVIKRIQNMLLKICKILDEYSIDVIYMEKAFSKQNVDTTMKLANLAGGMLLYCAKNEIKFVHPMPSEWRARIGIEQNKKIKRDVLKAEAIKAVKNEYGIDVGDDLAESILLARSAFDLPKINITEDDLWKD